MAAFAAFRYAQAQAAIPDLAGVMLAIAAANRSLNRSAWGAFRVGQICPLDQESIEPASARGQVASPA